jgi:hypothetical protein
MNQRDSIRFWNRFVLSALVLLAVGSAMCTVAASAAAHHRDASFAATVAR